jgi:DNA-binding MarR family transcriptional regulator
MTPGHAAQTGQAATPAPTNAPLLERNGRLVLDLDHYIPFLLSAIANKWSRSSSHIYLAEFGVGVTEWRIMAMLALEPRVTAYRICQVIGLDKAATSRALRALEGRGLVSSWQDDPQNHRKTVELTAAGEALHDRIIRRAHSREEILLADLSSDEVQVLAGMLRRMMRRVPDIMGPEAPER